MQAQRTTSACGARSWALGLPRLDDRRCERQLRGFCLTARATRLSTSRSGATSQVAPIWASSVSAVVSAGFGRFSAATPASSSRPRLTRAMAAPERSAGRPERCFCLCQRRTTLAAAAWASLGFRMITSDPTQSVAGRTAEAASWASVPATAAAARAAAVARSRMSAGTPEFLACTGRPHTQQLAWGIRRSKSSAT